MPEQDKTALPDRVTFYACLPDGLCDTNDAKEARELARQVMRLQAELAEARKTRDHLILQAQIWAGLSPKETTDEV